MTEYNLEELLPHKAPMIFLSAVESVNLTSGNLTARIDIKKTDMLYSNALQGVPSYTALEYMAQAIGCFVGIYDRKLNPQSTPGVGFVLGTRKLTLNEPVFHLDNSYYVDVHSLFNDENIASFECRIRDSAKNLAEAIINAYRPTNLNDFIKEYL